jgi:hypothetical protein
MKAILNEEKTEGTFAVPRYFIHESSPVYEEVQKLFKRIKWASPHARADARMNRFNAFTSLLWAVTTDKNFVVYTDLNKSSYNIRKWPIPHRAMSETVKALEAMGWLKHHGVRTKNRQIRYRASGQSPMRKMPSFKVYELPWNPPVVQIRLGRTDLLQAPWDIELMANPKWKGWIKEDLLPPMEELNDKLLGHEFVLFPYGKSDDVQAQYRRIFTNLPQADGQPRLTHGRIYPSTFNIPSKTNGWRQRTLIDGNPTSEIDVHASGLRLLAEDGQIGFDLPDTEDLYTYGQLSGLDRKLTKKVVQAVINRVSLDRQSWPKSFRDDKKTSELIAGRDWKTYAKAIGETYPALSKVRKDHGMDLMLIESDIIIRAMNYLLDKGIGCLSIHDCLIAPTDSVEDAKKALLEAYSDKGFRPPQLAVEWSSS